jgi:hypothetical protein
MEEITAPFAKLNKLLQQQQQEDELPDFSPYVLDISKKPKSYVPLLSIRDTVIFSRCSISAITGKAKSRKSTLMICLSKKFLDEYPNGKLMIIDTEMAEFYVHRNAVKLHKLAGFPENVNHERIVILQFRELSTEKRFEMFSNAIKKYKPDLVFLDGVRDLIVNYNEIDDVVELIDEIMRLSNIYKCHICSIIHENKGNTDLRGHLGTELQNKAETVIAVATNKEDKNFSKISARMTRNMPFDDFQIGMDNYGMPYFVDDVSSTQYKPYEPEPTTPINPDKNHEPESEALFESEETKPIPF